MALYPPHLSLPITCTCVVKGLFEKQRLSLLVTTCHQLVAPHRKTCPHLPQVRRLARTGSILQLEAGERGRSAPGRFSRRARWRNAGHPFRGASIRGPLFPELGASGFAKRARAARRERGAASLRAWSACTGGQRAGVQRGVPPPSRMSRNGSCTSLPLTARTCGTSARR